MKKVLNCLKKHGLVLSVAVILLLVLAMAGKVSAGAVPIPGKAVAQPRVDFTPAEMAIKLNASTAEYGGCTASKIGEQMWLTAKHCVRSSRIETETGYLYPRSVTLAWQDKTGGRKEDWAIVNTATADRSIPALQLGCNDSVYPGMPVAYLGFPGKTDRAFIMGYVSTMRQVRNGGANGADWVLDLPVAGGASGAAIVSMHTGHIIAIVTEGVTSARTGFFLAAAESVKNLDWCEDYNAHLLEQDEFDETEGSQFIPAPAPKKDIGHT